jgi:leucyl aminopeptidase (aminopeptidase T)
MMYEMELIKAAQTLVKDVLQVKKGEEVLIYADSAADEAVTHATAGAVLSAGGTPAIILFQTKKNPAEEPPATVAAALMAADVVVEFSVQYLLYTKAQLEALEKRNRVFICLTGCDTEAMVRTIGMIDYMKVIELGNKLAEMTTNAKEIRITSPSGTDFTGKIGGREWGNYGTTADKFNFLMLGGQTGGTCVEESMNGVLAIDGNLWPPDEVRQDIDEPVKLKIDKGVIKDISGGTSAGIFKKWMESLKDQNMYRIAHICYGYNPGARITGNIAEVERVWGCVQYGWGTQGPLLRPDLGGKVGWRAESHCDGIILNPSVYLDGQPVEENGKYVHKDLVPLVKALGME